VNLTGEDIRDARKAAGLSQAELGKLAGIGRHAVSYWECKVSFRGRGYALRQMAKALGRQLPHFVTPASCARGDGVLAELPDNRTITRGRGDGVISNSALSLHTEKLIATDRERRHEQAAKRASSLRVQCCAKTRKGIACRNMSEAGRKRCKFHGGMSTGARTPEGIERIREAQHRRWERHRLMMSGNHAG
jgi:transcriptional regulator with XRE-family HTH domain